VEEGVPQSGISKSLPPVVGCSACLCYVILCLLSILIYLLGEPFTQEEMEEMFSAALNQEDGNIVYKDFVPLMLAASEESH